MEGDGRGEQRGHISVQNNSDLKLIGRPPLQFFPTTKNNASNSQQDDVSVQSLYIFIRWSTPTVPFSPFHVFWWPREAALPREQLQTNRTLGADQ